MAPTDQSYWVLFVPVAVSVPAFTATQAFLDGLTLSLLLLWLVLGLRPEGGWSIIDVPFH